MLRHLIPYSYMQQVSLPGAILLLLLLLSSFGELRAAIPAQQGQLLQFTAAGHVLGFQSDGYYIADGDHMLHVGFVGTAGVTPMADGAGEGAGRLLNSVSYDNLWSGVNLRYEAVADGIVQSTWKIAPGAHVESIRLSYNAPLEIAADGSLKIHYITGWMQESAPIAWQEIDGLRRPVEVSFRLAGVTQSEHVIGFELGRYDANHPLLIDPTLVWNTTLGSGTDSGWGIAVDRSGNVYVAGRSDATWGSPLSPHAGDSDAFVAKLNSSGQLQWNTFMGSAGDTDQGNAIVAGGRDNIFIAGSESVECNFGYASPPDCGIKVVATISSSQKRGW